MSTQTEFPRSRRLSKDKRVAEIMQVARQVLRERGAEQFLTSEVAERCGISEGTIYKYFATRRELMVQVAEQWFEEALFEEHPDDRGLPFRERLLQNIRKNLTMIRTEPLLTRFMLGDLRADPNYRSTRMHQLNRRNAKSFLDIVQDGIADGELRADIDLRIVRNMIQGCIEYQIWSYLRGEGEFSVEHSAQGITDVIVRGIGASVAPATDLQDAVARLATIADRIDERLGGN